MYLFAQPCSKQKLSILFHPQTVVLKKRCKISEVLRVNKETANTIKKLQKLRFWLVTGLCQVPSPVMKLYLQINILAMSPSLPAGVHLFKAVISSWAVPAMEKVKRTDCWSQTSTWPSLAMKSTEK